MASLPSNFYAVGFEPVLIVGGKEFPIVSLRVEYVLNSIPVAYVDLPCGYEMSYSPTNKTSGLLTFNNIAGKQEASIVVKLKSEPGIPVSSGSYPYTDGKYEIFKGYVVAHSAGISTESVSSSVILQHWLSDLDNTAFAGGQFFTNAPNNWFIRNPISSSVPSSNPLSAMIGSSNGQTYAVKSLDIANGDIWSEVIQPVMRARIADTTNSVFSNNTSITLYNKKTAEALEKVVSAGLTLNTNAKNAFNNNQLNESFFSALYSILYGTDGGNSTWTKMLSALSPFNVVAAPMVNKCQLIPFSAVYAPTHTLTAKDFNLEGFSANPTILPMGLVMYGLPASALSVLPQNNGPLIVGEPIENTFLGEFVVNSTAAKLMTGPVYTIPIPPCFQVSQQAYNRGISSTVLSSPAFNRSQGMAAKPVVAPTANAVNMKQSFFDVIAQNMYFTMVLNNKTQDVVCPFRLDISPGAVLQLNGTNPAVSGNSTNWSRRGVVEAVIYTFSNNPPTIRTTYRLKHIMDNIEEEAFKSYISTAHPLMSGAANGDDIDAK